MPTRRRLLRLPLLALAACQSPGEACLDAAVRELRIVEALVAETQGNLERGYAVEEEQVLREVTDFCEVTDEDGRTHHEFCRRTEVRDVERAVAIDPEAERRELEGLLARRDALLTETAARRRACLAAYPA